MPNKQTMEVGLKFTADTTQARAQLKELKTALNDAIGSAKFKTFKGTPGGLDFSTAIKQASELTGIIESASNAMGDFDLTKFTKAFKEAGFKDLSQVQTILHGIGADDAFDKLAMQIASSNANVNLLQRSLGKFWDGLKNTAMWTIQSNAIHAVESALSSAYGYAQKLNKGLTDIAIVSDLDTQQLTQFARTANQMAKELSASTTEYVQGALIYYQAGLSDEEVIERTNTTIKMAQTSGETAEAISSYMTAIWNNFYDGSKSVEYYADAISYLGAVTAASNADIAEGMQAFAATAETVGLSFEYGASALTLLRDITQQSASTIGNSLKTIFARLSSVAQGDTLEDGVDLTKYSKALAQVGVNVLDINGDLRDMDSILDDLGSRWDALNDAQKVALAQTVGGVRQYNNLISLMDNYEYFQELVQESTQSEGYLNHQAEIYADSWEAAANRLEAAWQGIYDQIIDDKFFIKLTDFLTFIVNLIGDVIDGMGGLKGLIPTIVSAFMSINPGQTAKDFQNLVTSILTLGQARSNNIAMQLDALDQLKNKQAQFSDESPLYDFWDQQKQINLAIVEAQVKGDTTRVAQLSAIRDLNNNILTSLQEQEKKVEETKDLYYDINTAMAYAQQFGNKDAAIQYLTNTDVDINSKKAYLQSLTPTTMGAMGFGKNIQAQINKIDWDNFNDIVLESIIKSFQRSRSWTAGKMEKYAGKDAVNQVSKEVNQQKELTQAVEETSQKREESEQTIEQENQEERKIVESKQEENKVQEEINEKLITQQQLAKKIQDEYNLTEGQAEEIAQQIETMRKLNSDVLGNKETSPWAIMTTSAIRAANSLVSMSAGMDGLLKSIKDGNISLGSLAGSIGSIWTGAKIATSAFTDMGKTLAGSTGIIGLLQKAFEFLGGHIFLVVGIVIALTAGFKLLQKAQEDAYNRSTEGRIEANNKALEEQKSIISDLTTEYKNLKSIVNSLSSSYEELKDLAPGSAAYLIALKEYEAQLKELENKYGADIYVDPNAEIKQISQAALDQAILRELYAAEARENYLLNKSEKLNTQKIRDEINDRRAQLGDGISLQTWSRETNNSLEPEEQYNYYRFQGENGYLSDEYLDEESYNQLYDNFLALIASEDLTSNNFTQKFHEIMENAGIQIDGAIYNYFLNQTEELINQLGKQEDSYLNYGNLLASAFAANGIFGATEQSGISRDTVLETINKNIEEEIDQYLNDIEQKNKAIKEIEDAQKLEYIEGEGFYNLKEDGTRGDKVDIDAEEIIKEQFAAWIASDWAKLDAAEQAQKLKDLGLQIDESIVDKMIQDAANAAQLSADVARASSFGLDTEEFKEYVSYLEKYLADLNLTQSELDEIAIANMRINQGVKSLIDNYSNWSDIITEAQKDGNEWMRMNIEYQQSMDGIRNALGDIANLELDEIEGLTDEFILDNLKLIEEASYGNVDAIDNLIKAIAIDFAKTLEDSKDNITSWEQQLIDSINEVNFNEIRIGTSINDQPFYEAIQHMIETGAIASDEINAMLARIGYAPIVDYQTVTATHYTHDEGSATGTIAYINPETGEEVTAEIEHNDSYNNISGKTDIKVPIIKGTNGNTPTFATAQNMSSALSSSVFTGGTGQNVTQTNRNAGAKNRPSSSGSSSKKSKTADTTRYHEINSKLEQTSHYLDMVNTAEDRAYGQTKLDLIDEKIKLLEREAEQYKELYDEAKRYYDADRERLESQYGAAFNLDSSIANYDEWYKQFVDRYNAGGMDDDAWSAFEDAISKYEDSLKHLNDAEKKYQDDLNKIYDEKLEKIEYRVKTLNKLLDQSIDYLDYLIKQLDKDMYDTAEVVALLGEKTGDILAQIANYQEGIEDILANHGLESDLIQQFLQGNLSVGEVLEKLGDLTEEEVSTLQDYTSQLLKLNETMIELREEAYEKIGESIDEFNEKIELQIDVVNDLEGVMKHYQNIIDIVGKDTLGISDEMLRQLNNLSITSAEAALRISTNELERNRQILEDLYAEYQRLVEAGLDEDAALLKQQIEAQEDRVRQLSESWASAFEDALKAASDAFSYNVKLATDAFDKAVAGSMGNLANLQDMYDKQKTLDDLYLDDYERIYELNKLNRDVTNAIDNTDNIAGKERLLALQQEINDALANGNELSEYDVEFMQKRLELEMAQIALEEAQNAKNMVRMTRDNEGNWSYVYTADATASEKAKQDYEDKLYELEKLNQTHIKETQDLMLNLLAQYRDEIANLNVTDEERAQMLQDYWEHLQEEYGMMLDKALADGAWITRTYDVYDHELIDGWDETLLHATTGFDTLEEYMENFMAASGDMIAGTIDAYTQWGIDYEQIFRDAGTNVDDFADKVDEDMDKVREAMVGGEGDEGYGGAVGAAAEMADKLKEEFEEILENLRNWFSGQGGYSSQMDSVIKKNEEVYKSINELINQYARLSNVNVSYPALQGGGGSSSPTAGGGTGGGNDNNTVGNPRDNTTKNPTAPIYTYSTWTYASDITCMEHKHYSDGSVKDAATSHDWEEVQVGNYLKRQCRHCKHLDQTIVGRGIRQTFASGGYTGSWGPEGRQAILHEKELVLNKADTQNLLTTVGFVRDLTRMISLNAADASTGLGNLISGGVGQGGGYLDQTVTIHAEFPNATNHSEIEEAFSNLIGLASQYAGRKK